MTFTSENTVEEIPGSTATLTRLLVVDSDQGVRWSLEHGLSHTGYQVGVASTPEAALTQARDNGYNAVLMEIAPKTGLTVEVLSEVIECCGSPVIVCSSVSTSPNIVMECIRRGASGFLSRPFSLSEVRSELSRALSPEENRDAKQSVGEDDHAPSLIVGISQPIQELRNTIRLIAKSNLNCLIRGESGVGKDVVAREIHRLSPRNAKPFVKVNCGALPEQLLESELFGYEKGAFTGASQAKPGRFTLADQGIIFLDEICDVSIPLQAKLLQVIEHKEFTKLGGVHPTQVDVQIIAASNANFEQLFNQNAFRQDLFFRLNEVCLRVPPLVERKEDIPLLVKHFMKKYSPPNAPAAKLSDAELDSLCSYHWPGNVRELESTIKRWLSLGKLVIGSAYPHDDAPINGTQRKQKKASGPPAKEPTVDEIRRVLEECQWNRRAASKVLGVSYQTLRRRIIKYGLMDPEPS